MSNAPLRFPHDTTGDVASPATVCYVYGVARPSGDCATLPPLDSVTGILPGAPLGVIQHRDLLALVSEAPASEFDQQGLERNLDDARWVQERAVAHQAVLSHLLSGYTVIPFAFCSIYSSRENVSAMLAANDAELDHQLRRLEGALEWGVKLYCDVRQLKASIAESSSALEAQRRALAKASAGAAYLLRKRLETGVDKEAESATDQCAQNSHDRLAARARRSTLNANQSVEVHGRLGSTMVLNGAYLVDRADQSRFEADLAELQASNGDIGFRYELSGPWPPYNFVSKDLKQEADRD